MFSRINTYCQEISCCNPQNLSTAIKKYAEEVRDTIDCGNCGTNQLYHVQYSED